VLQALGVKIDLTPAEISRCIREAGIGFMFAPAHHQAMKHVGPTRAEIGTRTMFNLLGPQANPAGARRYMLGVYAKQWVEPVAAALLANRAISAWVVHGDSGLDELSTTGPSFVASIRGGNLTSFEVKPEDAGVQRATLADLKGADPAYNAGRLRTMLEGARDPYRDVVLLNAAAAFIVAGRADTLKLGADLAAHEIDSGRARAKLEKLISVSNG
jgi:anthranilate phosphoribosyltransferase